MFGFYSQAAYISVSRLCSNLNRNAITLYQKREIIICILNQADTISPSE